MRWPRDIVQADRKRKRTLHSHFFHHEILPINYDCRNMHIVARVTDRTGMTIAVDRGHKTLNHAIVNVHLTFFHCNRCQQSCG